MQKSVRQKLSAKAMANTLSTLTLAWKPSTQTAYADENAVGITPEDAIAGISGSILFPQTAFSIADAFDFRLAFTDGYDAATGMAGVKKAFANLHLAGCGKGVGIGQYASNDGENPKFECAYPAYVYGDLTVSGVTHGLQAMVVAKDENFAGASGPGAAYARLIPFDTVKLSAGTALSFDAGACGIRIGAGVSYVRARASVSFTTGFTANQAITRMVYILCNDTVVCDYFTILPGVANLYTRLNSDEVLFPVSEGDVICAKCGSYSGNAGVMNLAVLTVEAVG